MYPFPEQHLPQGLDVRRAQTLFLAGLTAILVCALAIAVIAFEAAQPRAADAQVTSPGPAVYGWLPATQIQATEAGADLGAVDASRTGPAVYGWLPDAQGTSADASNIGPAVYGWLPDAQVQAASEGH
jgi:hypothetical protein